MKFIKKAFVPLLAFLFVLGLFSILPKSAFAAGEFITTWKTDNFGTSNSTSITIPTYTGETYNYSIDWDNDGTPDETGITGDVTHDFGVAGTYTIRITGTFPRIYFNFDGDAPKIISVDQWGSIAWTSMRNAFGGCINLVINASGAPDLSGVTDMTSAFSASGPLGSSINTWDVSTITSISGLFFANTVFNQSLSNWDTSQVTDMSTTFRDAVSFNQDIGNWDVSNVVNMSSMFFGATAFNQPLRFWNVNNVTRMDSTFQNSGFNQDIGDWNISSLESADCLFCGGGLSVKNYDSILAKWSQVATQGVDPVIDFGSSNYCNQSARDILVNIKGWSIFDAGLATCHTLTYTAGVGGILSGGLPVVQNIADGADGDVIMVAPNSGYLFTGWSDGSTQNPRTDTNVTGDISVTANFALIPTSNTSSGSVSGGTHFGCKDPAATNYEQFSASKPELCKYATVSLVPSITLPTTLPRILKFGMSGDDVVALQNYLKVTPVPSKIFGPKTKKAVQAFQKTKGLIPDGIVGPKTRMLMI